MRVKKTTNESTILYGWDSKDRIFAEYDDRANAIQETVYFGSIPIALLKDGNTYQIFADQIDTPRAITDNSNNTLWVWNSKPFGDSKPNEDMDGDESKLSYNLRFPGQYFDEETGKHYNFNRDYNPLTGGYIQSDPKGLCGSKNTYIYVDSNPLIDFDKHGLLSCNQCLSACNGNLSRLCRKIRNSRARALCWGATSLSPSTARTVCKNICYWYYCD